MIKAVIIEDEPAMQEVNSRLLAEYFPEIKLSGIAGNVESGIELIHKHQPKLVFLDIELEDKTGFELLQALKPYSFKVIFITAFNHFAIKAIKFSALDYLVKPVADDEFILAVKRAINDIEINLNSTAQATFLLDNLKREFQNKKIVLKTIDSLHILDIRKIIFCRSDNSYTTFYTDENEKIIVSKSIKEYEELLKSFNFFRPHQSYLVNLNHVQKIDKSDGGFIIMKNKKEIPVSTRQMKNLLNLLAHL